MDPLDSWVWKEEPISPSSSNDYGDDKWLNFDDESVSSIINDNETSDSALYEENDSPSRAQVASKLLDELDEWIKEEPFSDWLEDKVLLFDELPAQECAQNKIIYPTAVKQQEPEQDQSTTQLLLQEFETVLGGVEACHQIYPVGHLTLTPPQSPPPPAPAAVSEKINQQLPITPVQLFPTFQPQTPPVQQQYHQEIQSKNEETTALTKSYFNQISGVWNAENISLNPLADDVDSELAAVDEYVRSCAEDMSPSSPCTSTNGSYTSEDSTDDPEWTVNTSSASSSTSSSNSKINNSKQRNQRLSKTRSKPYSRPTIEDKKVRKKEQNKNAATRYRQKKKNEIKEIVGEEQELMDYNDKLNDQVKDLQREVGYLKGLMRDLFKAKGLIK